MRLRRPSPRCSQEATPGQSTCMPEVDMYLTDGASLFRVAGTLLGLNEDMLVELEDCHTLELLLLPAREAPRLGLQPVGFPR